MKQTLLQFANKEELQLGIWYQNRLVGCIGYPHLDWANRKVEIGYWIDASMQGKGLGTRVCRALVTYAFDQYRLNKVEILCATGNTRSRAIPERPGFIQEGSFDKVSGSLTTTTIWWSMECWLVNGADRQRLLGGTCSFSRRLY
jgi:ribosomal-protein-serine acetyltransferase